MNDRFIVEDIRLACEGPNVQVLNEDFGPDELRAFCRESELVITGRFHGMVSALAVGTPPVVLGWNHKYEEVLAQFELEGQCLPISELSSVALWEVVDRAVSCSAEITAAITENLPTVVRSAWTTIDAIDGGGVR